MSESVTPADITVVRNEDAGRYEIHVDGELAGFTVIEVGAEVTVLPHTEIDEKFGGRGLGTTLVRLALDDIRARGDRIVPVCPLVKRFIEKNPDYADLVA
ncbi:MAG TPA: GNAT family N-acetyltransferase [Jatrophihabitans sp.]|jgi:predicted GNAT family acetyltransferase